MKQTAFNYVNSIIGSGVIGIPYAIHKAGFFMGIFLLIFIAAITDFSLCTLIRAGNLAGVSTYQDVMDRAFGKPGFYILTILQFIYPFIAMISYNVIIGDTMTKVFRRIFDLTSNNPFGNRNTVVFMCTVMIMLPISLYRNVSKLNKISLTSIAFVSFIMSFIAYRLVTLGPDIPHEENAFTLVNSGITNAIGIIAFAYMCHHNSFLLYDSMANSSQEKWNRVTHLSLAVSCFIVMVVGICGYLTFGSYSQGDLFENYCLSDDFAQAARLAFTVTIMLTYPFECFVVREVLENAFWGGKPPSTNSHHTLLTIAIAASAFILSTLTDCLGIVLELNGIIAAVPLAFIFPALTFIKLDPEPLMSRQKFPHLALVIFGVAVACVGSFLAVQSVLDGISCSHGHELFYCNQTNSTKSATINFNHSSETQ
ncbi:putative sodium-coupled neutral amino acid transporter 11 isoform X2 [Panonychus citri]|nr:putative sodium-coupled neutral amino acid transporter 11 isoform X2 [Panonychus citri]